MTGKRLSVLLIVALPREGESFVVVVPWGGWAVVGLKLVFVGGESSPLPSVGSSSSSSVVGRGTGRTVGLVRNCDMLPLQRSLPEQKQ
jgi:hypothetical protein